MRDRSNQCDTKLTFFAPLFVTNKYIRSIHNSEEPLDLRISQDQPLDLSRRNAQGDYNEGREGGDSGRERVRAGLSRDGVLSGSESADDYAERYRAVERRRWRLRVEDETAEQREARLAGRREYASAQRAECSSSEREANNADALSRVQRQRSRISDLSFAAFEYDPKFDYAAHPKINIGRMDDICKYCKARRFRGETKGICCANGQVRLDSFNPPPEPIFTLFSGLYPESNNFLRNIRRYNDSFQMTSFGVQGEGIVQDGWSPNFRIQGKIYHLIGSLLPQPSAAPRFLQIYFTGDAHNQVDLRTRTFLGTKREIIALFQSLFDERNRLIHSFKTALDQMPSDEARIVIRADKTPAGEHERVFNAPTDNNNVAIILIDGEQSRRDIVIRRRNDRLERIDEMHPSYDALHYPIIFWEGNDTYSYNFFKRINPETGAQTNRKVTTMDFYRYHLMIRDENQNFLLMCRSLFHQFITDSYAKIQSERLRYYSLNQSDMRSSEYIELADALATDGDALNVGRRVILPSTFIGGPRHLAEYSQDAMAYCRIFGRPDLFITFTCNPNWKEVSEYLMPAQVATDRPDLTARVFKEKLDKLMEVLTKHQLFGPSRGHVYTIEWQKRGLPHAHILLWLTNRLRPDQVDKLISAELPDKDLDPILFGIVIKHMIHGPCGGLNPNSPCMDPIRHCCTKKYPRAFISDTMTGDDGYPTYRRRKPDAGGFCFRPQGRTYMIDNSWVVPYSPVLLRIFNAHINIEYCQSVKSIKYICKYIHKGCDKAIIERTRCNPNDEVEMYQLGRYLDSNESNWRILGFSIHDRYPAVIQLSVHLENGQRVQFSTENANAVVQNPPDTTLTAFFKLNQVDSFARTLLYSEIPKYYTWDKSKKIFSKRKQGAVVAGWDGRAADVIGRMYTVHPKHTECFFLRILLTKIRGPTSFESLRTYEGRVCSTYREACLLHGFVESDDHWINTLSEAALCKMPEQMRSLFAVVICLCNPSDPLALWERFKRDLSEDILIRQRREIPGLDNLDFNQSIFNSALIMIEDICLNMPEGRLLTQLGLPAPDRDAYDPLNMDIVRETSYDVPSLEEFVATNVPRLNPEQTRVFNTLSDAIERREGKLFFLDAPGGTGKSFVLNLLLAKFRASNRIIIAVASSGIAATVLAGGRTVHSVLKLPLDIDKKDQPMCNIKRGTSTAALLQRCDAIVWDESTMSHRKSLEAVERTLRDVRNSEDIFGGIVMILSGDFRQTLPVVQRGTMRDEISACLKQSMLWHHVNKLNLTTNMRVYLTNNGSVDHFSQSLLSVGNGTFPSDDRERISFTNDLCQIVSNRENLIEKVFPNLLLNLSNRDWLRERVILATKNDAVDEINFIIQEKIDRPSRSYSSIDEVVDPDQAVNYPVEFLNSLSIPGIPPHRLTLKVGSPIILMRNISPPKLCNGTRLVVERLHNYLIEATIMVGPHKGERVFIPRIKLQPDGLVFDFYRKQFPVRLAFAMTINKSQGQSLNVVGIDLSEQPFSHGQLYVALSRVGCPSNIFVSSSEEDKAKNVVYRSVLQ